MPHFAAHRRTAVGNQRTTCFSQIAHYTPAFVAAHFVLQSAIIEQPASRKLHTTQLPSSPHTVVEVSLLPPYAAPASLRTGSRTGQPRLQLPQLELSPRVLVEQGPSSSPDFSAEIPPAEPVVTTNIDIVTGSRMNCRVTTVEGLPSSTGLNSS